jgi:hypothetical protein
MQGSVHRLDWDVSRALSCRALFWTTNLCAPSLSLRLASLACDAMCPY